MDKTLISELEYLIDLNLIDHPEVNNLVVRAIHELKRNKYEIYRLNEALSAERWKGAICTGSY